MNSASDDRRGRILDASERLFAEDGFDATATARIAGTARVPKGLIFYYFPRKIDILLTLLEERLPRTPLCRPEDVVSEGDPAGSLVRLERRLGLDRHESLTLREVIFRESGTHPEVRERLRLLRDGLLELTEAVLEKSVGRALDPKLRRQAAQTFVAVMLDRANARRFGGAGPDLEGAARIVSLALGGTGFA